jgi:serine/threonine-protein kinase
VHEQLGRRAAIKIVSADFANDDRVIQRFMREARTVSQLGHPNIVDVYDLGSLDDHRPFLVMERLFGTNFHDLLTREGRMEPARVVELLDGVAAALDLVHAKGIIHRDVKLENLMLSRTDDGAQVVKILDFGIAAMMNPSADQPKITAQNMITGTPLYIAPEAAGGLRPDHRADIYALAVCAYLMLTSVAPFDSDSALLILMRKMAEEPPSLKDNANDLEFNDALEEVIAKGLARHPDDRYSTARAFVQDMREVVDKTADLETSDVTEGGAHPPFGIADVFTEPGDTPIETPMATSKAIAERRAEEVRHSTPPSKHDSQYAIASKIRREQILKSGILFASLVLIGVSMWILSGRKDEPRVEATSAETVSTERLVDEAAHRAEEAAKAAEARAQAAQEAQQAAERRAAEAEASAKKVEKKTEKRIEKKIAPKARLHDQPIPVLPLEQPELEKPEPPKVDMARADAATKRGMKLLVGGQLPEAIAEFRDATLAAPRYALAWRQLGLANEKMGRTKEAAAAYRQYLKLSSGEDSLVVDEVKSRLEALEK